MTTKGVPDMMKKLIATGLILFAMSVFASAALAEEVKVSVTATPAELTDSGTVAFNFTISNYSDYELSNVLIHYNGADYAPEIPGGIIPMNGELREVILPLPVAGNQLGNPIEFIVSGIRNGETVTASANITLQRASNPSLVVTRTADKISGMQDDTVKLTYTVKNETKFDMSDIIVIDEDISDDPILKLDTLIASTSYGIDYTYTIGDHSVSSEPFATYTVNGKMKSFSSIEPLEITMILVKLNMTVRQGVPSADGTMFQIDISNVGNQAIQDISIRDERQNLITGQSFSLDAGDSSTFSYQVIPIMTESVRDVRFLLDGTDELGGTYHLESSQAYQVLPFIDEAQIKVSLDAETLTPWDSESRNASVCVKIHNSSGIPLTNATLSEPSLGTLMTYDALPSGETVFNKDVEIDSPYTFVFTLSAQDPTGAQRTLSETAWDVPIDSPSTPHVSEAFMSNEEDASIFSRLNGTVLRILLLLGALLILGFATLIVLSVIERKKVSRDTFYHEDEYEDEYLLDDLFDEQPPRKRRGSAEGSDFASYSRDFDAVTKQDNQYTNYPVHRRENQKDDSLPALPNVYETSSMTEVMGYNYPDDYCHSHNPIRPVRQADGIIDDRNDNVNCEDEHDDAYAPRIHVGGMRAGNNTDLNGEPIPAPKIVDIKAKPVVKKQSKDTIRRVRKPDARD